ncbi:hypothetical protein SAMN02745219_03459 [Desulfofundulus thermosubterraneus DSM 16057]|uniref:Uncharacterized protein n=1 Tax=Desulfofundulus thermosubterraneus DSM 16057 TaxID=1121432 RepID=A0A1M6MKJ9_9FIRM|nr:hypothetical protein SAMN02745219_03459 [Desulfofundulus thermosubterraneus DSM 16057]
MENNLEKATGILQKLSVESLKTAISLLELLALKVGRHGGSEPPPGQARGLRPGGFSCHRNAAC